MSFSYRLEFSPDILWGLRHQICYNALCLTKRKKVRSVIISMKQRPETECSIPEGNSISNLTDTLTGIVKNDYDIEDVKAETLAEKYSSEV